MNVVLIGATGATGKELLGLLLNDDEISKVIVLARKEINIKHDKLFVHVIDFDNASSWSHLVVGDVALSCLGTTLKTAGNKANQWKVDYDYQYAFAKAARRNQCEQFVLVSSAYASVHSKFYYSRMKGQLEEDVKKLKFEKLVIFQPPLLLRKDSDRLGEVFSGKVLKALNAFGLLKSLKPLSTLDLAFAMKKSIYKSIRSVNILSGQQIRIFLDS